MTAEIALPKNIKDILQESFDKMLHIDETIGKYDQALNDLKKNCLVHGVWSGVNLPYKGVYKKTVEESLLKSTWRAIYQYYGIENVASANDKNRFEQLFVNPPSLTPENIILHFAKFIDDPYYQILRGLAEVFCSLDPAYKSHTRVKIGVKGLPKRIIISDISSLYGRNRLVDVLNAIAQYQQRPHTTYQEIDQLLKDDDIWQESRGVKLKRFANGNGHLFFNPETLKDINLALAEFYGDALSDDGIDKDINKSRTTQLAKDLQYYPTPTDVIYKLLPDCNLAGMKVLEPSCGDGRILAILRKKGADAFGVEVHPGRVQECKNKHLNVMQANFLQLTPTPEYDYVIMNPPFYGKHYLAHIEHALRFLKPKGVLRSILPSTARYDHKELQGKGHWFDLPVASFKESGTNIATSIITINT